MPELCSYSVDVLDASQQQYGHFPGIWAIWLLGSNFTRIVLGLFAILVDGSRQSRYEVGPKLEILGLWPCRANRLTSKLHQSPSSRPVTSEDKRAPIHVPCSACVNTTLFATWDWIEFFRLVASCSLGSEYTLVTCSKCNPGFIKQTSKPTRWLKWFGNQEGIIG